MTEHDKDAAIAKALDVAVGDRQAEIDALPPAERDDANSLLEVADLLWTHAHGAPPLQQDSVAAMLGLVPDASRALDPEGLRSALSSAGLKVSELAELLSARGWQITTRDAFNWRAGHVTDVAPALIQAIAEATRSRPERLTARSKGAARGDLADIVALPRFQGLAERWAALMHTSLGLASSALESRLAATVYRGDTPDAEQLLSTLETVVDHLEAGSSHD
jgi:hypothetical protein